MFAVSPAFHFLQMSSTLPEGQGGLRSSGEATPPTPLVEVGGTSTMSVSAHELLSLIQRMAGEQASIYQKMEKRCAETEAAQVRLLQEMEKREAQHAEAVLALEHRLGQQGQAMEQLQSQVDHMRSLLNAAQADLQRKPSPSASPPGPSPHSTTPHVSTTLNAASVSAVTNRAVMDAVRECMAPYTMPNGSATVPSSPMLAARAPGASPGYMHMQPPSQMAQTPSYSMGMGAPLHLPYSHPPAPFGPPHAWQYDAPPHHASPYGHPPLQYTAHVAYASEPPQAVFLPTAVPRVEDPPSRVIRSTFVSSPPREAEASPPTEPPARVVPFGAPAGTSNMWAASMRCPPQYRAADGEGARPPTAHAAPMMCAAGPRSIHAAGTAGVHIDRAKTPTMSLPYAPAEIAEIHPYTVAAGPLSTSVVKDSTRPAEMPACTGNLDLLAKLSMSSPLGTKRARNSEQPAQSLVRYTHTRARARLPARSNRHVPPALASLRCLRCACCRVRVCNRWQVIYPHLSPDDIKADNASMRAGTPCDPAMPPRDPSTFARMGKSWEVGVPVISAAHGVQSTA